MALIYLTEFTIPSLFLSWNVSISSCMVLTVPAVAILKRSGLSRCICNMPVVRSPLIWRSQVQSFYKHHCLQVWYVSVHHDQYVILRYENFQLCHQIVSLMYVESFGIAQTLQKVTPTRLCKCIISVILCV
jgi:hypothetical protein